MPADPWVDTPEARLEMIFYDYKDAEPAPRYLNLYGGTDAISLGLASLHERLDSLFKFMNSKAPGGTQGHYNAHESRKLLEIIEEINSLRSATRKAGTELLLYEGYVSTLESAEEWLEVTGGSPIPLDFTPIEIVRHERVFSIGERAIYLPDREHVQLKMMGEGAFAQVHSYTDPLYGIRFARKTLKRDASVGDIERFRREFDIMHGLSFPYILQVYKYDEKANSYTMEFCDSTLLDFVKKRNSQPSFDVAIRRRIALQFLYGLNYLHRKGFSHRDLSYRNILLKAYDFGAVMVKLSDFGLVKERDSDFTRTGAELMGTILDPALKEFKHYGPVNDIYAVGLILSFIFTGRQHLINDRSKLARLVHRCSHSDPSQRYQTVLEIINDLDSLDFSASGVLP